MPTAATTTKKTDKNAKRYTPAFQARVLANWKTMKAAGKSAAEVAARFKVHTSMLYYWKAKAEGRPWGGAAGNPPIRGGGGKKSANRKTASNGHQNGSRTRPHSRTDKLALENQVRELTDELALFKKIVQIALDGRM